MESQADLIFSRPGLLLTWQETPQSHWKIMKTIYPELPNKIDEMAEGDLEFKSQLTAAIKNGIANNVNESTPEYILVTIALKGKSP